MPTREPTYAATISILAADTATEINQLVTGLLSNIIDSGIDDPDRGEPIFYWGKGTELESGVDPKNPAVILHPRARIVIAYNDGVPQAVLDELAALQPEGQRQIPMRFALGPIQPPQTRSEMDAALRDEAFNSDGATRAWQVHAGIDVGVANNTQLAAKFVALS